MDKQAIRNTINRMKTAAKAKLADVQRRNGNTSPLINDKVL